MLNQQRYMELNSIINIKTMQIVGVFLVVFLEESISVSDIFAKENSMIKHNK